MRANHLFETLLNLIRDFTGNFDRITTTISSAKGANPPSGIASIAVGCCCIVGSDLFHYGYKQGDVAVGKRH